MMLRTGYRTSRMAAKVRLRKICYAAVGWNSCPEDGTELNEIWARKDTGEDFLHGYQCLECGFYYWVDDCRVQPEKEKR